MMDVIMLKLIMLSVVMLDVVMLSVFMLSVAAPFFPRKQHLTGGKPRVNSVKFSILGLSVLQHSNEIYVTFERTVLELKSRPPVFRRVGQSSSVFFRLDRRIFAAK